MVKLTIDDKVVEADKGWTIIDAANQAGIYIPTICYHESLSHIGSCRVCAVEIITDGKSELTTACTYLVEAGLKVRTSSEKVMKARRLTVELLLAQRPHSAKIQELARKLSIEEPNFTLQEKECILCDLCVRVCREIVEAEAIDFITQGKDRNVDGATVVHSPKKCIGCASCAYICPTEAITTEDIGDIRTINTPSGILKFKLEKCKICGKYWSPKKQLGYIIRKWNLEPEIFNVCPDCRE